MGPVIAPLTVWFSRSANLRLWFWFVVVVGLVPVLFRTLRGPERTFLHACGTGELFIVATIVCGAAIERSFAWLRQYPNQSRRPRPIRHGLMWEFVAVSVIVAILSCVWFGSIGDTTAPSDVALGSSIFWLASIVLAGTIVCLDDR